MILLLAPLVVLVRNTGPRERVAATLMLAATQRPTAATHQLGRSGSGRSRRQPAAGTARRSPPWGLFVALLAVEEVRFSAG